MEFCTLESMNSKARQVTPLRNKKIYIRGTKWDIDTSGNDRKRNFTFSNIWHNCLLHNIVYAKGQQTLTCRDWMWFVPEGFKCWKLSPSADDYGIVELC